MKTLKRVLLGLGALFACLLIFVGVMVFQAKSFRHENEAFIRRFMADYSRRWDAADVYGRLSTDCLTQIKSPDGQEAVAFFKRLGRLKEIHDVSVKNYTVGTNGKTGIFVFKARFEAAPTVVLLTLNESGGQVRVTALRITPSTELEPLAAAHSPI